jgi:hypothetical protein
MVEEKIEIVQKRTRLGSWIVSHQRQAHKYLDIIDEEEDDQSYSYKETDIFTEHESGDLQLVLIANMPFQCSESTETPECFLLAMPSNMGLKTCTERQLQLAVKSELQLHEGQMKDALQAVHLAIGKKAFIF